MIEKEINGIKILQFEIFQQFPKLQHAVFLRHGGVSVGYYSSLNLSYVVGDSVEAVLANEKKALSILNLSNHVRGNLCHGKRVVEASHAHQSLTFDGLTTNQLNLGLLITHADCQAACFYDPISHAVAGVHAGWKGIKQNIYAEAVFFMQETYGTKASNLHVAISPSLGPFDAEFVNFAKELPESFWDFQVKPQFFDFWKISEMQLIQCGILPHHIEIARISTYSNTHDYFSYRKERITGRNATLTAIL